MRLLIALLCSSLLVAGCSDPEPARPAQQQPPNLTVLSTGVIAKYSITPDELLKLQYYLDRELVITRQLAGGEREVAHGKVVIRNGLEVNEVGVAPLTQGVALRREPDGKGLDIGFDPTSQAALAFGPGPSGEYELGVDPKGKVPYDGSLYTPQTRGNRLLVDLEAVSRVVKTRRTLPGRTIDESK
jgi:hypothetical protein